MTWMLWCYAWTRGLLQIGSSAAGPKKNMVVIPSTSTTCGYDKKKKKKCCCAAYHAIKGEGCRNRATWVEESKVLTIPVSQKAWFIGYHFILTIVVLLVLRVFFKLTASPVGWKW